MHKSHYNQLFAFFAIVITLAVWIRGKQAEEIAQLKKTADETNGKTATLRFMQFRREEKAVAKLGGR